MLLARRVIRPKQLCQLTSVFSDACQGVREASSSTEDPNATGGPIVVDSIDNLQAAFATTPTEAADQLASLLTPAQRALLASALSKSTIDRESDERYVHDLFEAADIDGDKQHLNRIEFQHALHLHRSLDGSTIRTPPDWSALRMVFIAAAIPFIGFGFLDNFIMLVAGEEIDEAFGRKLGLSTLASAGLGNLVADVIGVGAANGIEARVRKLPYIRDFKLSKHQTNMPSTKVTKAIGATAGVMLGCILGLAPLFYSGTFFVPGGRL